jgi:TRAP-type C4-dicarboxylate transport system permease small subunit
MRLFESIVRNIGNKVMIVASIFLLSAMALTVANVLIRAFGGVIAGTYELTEIMIIVVAAGSLGYAVLEKSHVVVDVFVGRLSKRTQGIIDGVTSILGLGLWGAITWMSINIMLQRWLDEDSELLHVPYLPFRFLWIIAMIFICLAIVTDIVNALRRDGEK